MRSFLPLPFLLLCLLTSPTAAEELKISNFGNNELSGWDEKVFKKKTTYSLVQESDKTVLKAHSVKTASGLVRKVRLDTSKYPVLRWSWKIERSNGKEDIRKKSGDDFAARVYVVFPRGFFWRMRAISYVWGARLPKESVHPSPYTSNSMIVVVESGDEKAGLWQHEERNIYEDYRKVFKEEPPLLGGVAVMTDTDDTGEESVAWYGDITLSDK